MYEISRELDRLSSSVHSARPTVEEANSPFLACNKGDSGRSLKHEYSSTVNNKTNKAWEIILVRIWAGFVTPSAWLFGSAIKMLSRESYREAADNFVDFRISTSWQLKNSV